MQFSSLASPWCCSHLHSLWGASLFDQKKMQQTTTATHFLQHMAPMEVRTLFSDAHRNSLRMTVPADTQMIILQTERFLDIFLLLQFFLHLERDRIHITHYCFWWMVLESSGHLSQKIIFTYLIKGRKVLLSSLVLSLFSVTHINYACLLFFNVFLKKKKTWVSFQCLDCEKNSIWISQLPIIDLYKVPLGLFVSLARE